MSHSTKQRPFHPLVRIFLNLLTAKALLSHASQVNPGCSGRFTVEGSTLKLLIQQYVNSSEDAVECSYAFEAPQDSGLLVFANDITAVRDAEIPGCPVTIYDNADGSGQPVMSLCGHYRTQVIPVTTTLAFVVYKPEFYSVPYTLTLDLEVVSSGGKNLRTCGNSELRVVPTVPLKYSVGFRADSNPGRASDFCDLNVSSADNATMTATCILTSEGVCSYKVLSDVAVQESEDTVDLATVGGLATVRLFPASETGVLYLTSPAGFAPLTSLDPVDSHAMRSGKNGTWGSLGEVTEVETTVVETNAGENADSDEEESSNSDSSAPTIWSSITGWINDAWTTTKNTVSSAVSTVTGWIKGLF
ncbi:hypothetical protein HPB48_019121 [Haemaphysalis longicornis]|uniref:CUB domain-containing protein n=1 Tax=Haemaphysalis longicornis TaxID=44386 RepID=A0A9J6GB07_HAELO|nr:hypothetical protein HPB48_019121 [Haemaphysalis longicornis]